MCGCAPTSPPPSRQLPVAGDGAAPDRGRRPRREAHRAHRRARSRRWRSRSTAAACTACCSPGDDHGHLHATVQNSGPPRAVTAAEWAEALRPSRYCPSDQLEGFAPPSSTRPGRAELVPPSPTGCTGNWSTPRARAGRWTPPSTRCCRSGRLPRLRAPHDHAAAGARDPGPAGRGLRPGLSPMDFHAVVEADVDGTWCAVDATRLAPTSSLVRICSGRDAADTAFLSLFGGAASSSR